MSAPHSERIAFLKRSIEIQESYIADCKADRGKLMASFMAASSFAVSQQCIKELRDNETAIRAAVKKVDLLINELAILTANS